MAAGIEEAAADMATEAILPSADLWQRGAPMEPDGWFAALPFFHTFVAGLKPELVSVGVFDMKEVMAVADGAEMVAPGGCKEAAN